MFRRIISSTFAADDPASPSSPSSSRPRAKSSPAPPPQRQQRKRSQTNSPTTPTLYQSSPNGNGSPVTSVSSELTSFLEELQETHRLEFRARCDLLVAISSSLISRHDKSSFADAGGFLVCISILSSLEPSLSLPDSSSAPSLASRSLEESSSSSLESRLKLVYLVLHTLALSLRNHPKNQASFTSTVGFHSLVNAIKLSNLFSSRDEKISVLSALLCLLVDDFPNSGVSSSCFQSILSKQQDVQEGLIYEYESLFGRFQVHHEGLVPTLLDVIYDSDNFSLADDSHIRISILSILIKLSRTSLLNRFKMSISGSIKRIIEICFITSNISQSERDKLSEWLKTLLEVGLSTSEATLLLDSLITENGHAIRDDVLRIISSTVHSLPSPTYIHFTTRSSPPSYLHFKSLKKPFPPENASGYTFLLWMRLDEISHYHHSSNLSSLKPSSPITPTTPTSPSSPRDAPDSNEITLLKLCDASRQCYVHISIDSVSGCLTFRTSPNRKTAVKLKQHVFKSHQWYHIAITQSKPKLASSSAITLYVDGVEVGVEKAPWPSDPADGFPVEMFMGQHYDNEKQPKTDENPFLSPINNSPITTHWSWSAGPCWLWEEDLGAPAILLCSKVGPSYFGLFQDNLRRFIEKNPRAMSNITIAKTFEAKKTDKHMVSHSHSYSIENLLQLSKSSSSPSKDSSSSAAVFDQAKIYLAFDAVNAYHVNHHSTSNNKNRSNSNPPTPTSLIYTGISQSDRLLLDNALSSTGPGILNSGAIHLEVALKTHWGRGRLCGRPSIVSNERNLSSSIWVLGGIRYCLKLIELSQNRTQLHQTLLIFTNIVSLHWQATLEAESLQAYEILGSILRKKADKLDINIQNTIFQFVGIGENVARDSIINSGIALRSLAIDFTIWTRASSVLQINLLHQLTKMHRDDTRAAKHNVKRLVQMKACRRLITVLRTEVVQAPVREAFMETLSVMLPKHFSDVIRQFAIFLATEICSKKQTKAADAPDRLAQASLAFTALVDILLTPSHHALLEKFSSVVTIRWIFLFFSADVPESVTISALKLLSRLLSTQGKPFCNRFQNMFDGYRNLRHLLLPFCCVEEIYFILLSLLFSTDISRQDLSQPDNDLMQRIGAPNDIYLPVFTVLMTLIKEAFARTLDKDIITTATTTELLSMIADMSKFFYKTSETNAEYAALFNEDPFCTDVFNTLVPISSSLVMHPMGDIVNDTAAFPILKSQITDQDAHIVTVKSKHPSVLESHRYFANKMLAIISNKIISWVTGTTSKRSPVNPLSVLMESMSLCPIPTQIVLRTRFFYILCEHMDNIQSKRYVSRRFNSLLSYLTDSIFAGWFQNGSMSVLKIIFSYINTMLQQSITVLSATTSSLLADLLKNLNRLVLLTLVNMKPNNIDGETLTLIVQNQSILFDEKNEDPSFFKGCAFSLANTLSSSYNPQVLDFFKIMLLERKPHIYDGESTELHDIMISAHESSLQETITKFKESNPELQKCWDQLIQDETTKVIKILDNDNQIHHLAVQRSNQKFNGEKRHIQSAEKRLRAWAEKLFIKERTTLSNAIQDFYHSRNVVEQLWLTQQQHVYRLLIGKKLVATVEWELDPTEGPSRIRRKLQASYITSSDSGNHLNKPKDKNGIMDEETLVQVDRDEDVLDEDREPEREDQSQENKDAEEIEEEKEETFEEDKHRKIIKSLENGDVIRAVWNINRVNGLTTIAGLLLLGDKNIYICDGYFQSKSGQVMEASLAPENERDIHISIISELANSSTSAQEKSTQDLSSLKSYRWPYAELKEVLVRRFLFRDVALELFFDDGQSFILSFYGEDRNSALSHLLSKSHRAATSAGIDLPELRGLISTFSSKMSDVLQVKSSMLENFTRRWQNHEISNFEYLMACNTFASRTYNDITSYPVMPWILSNYDSDYLNLTDSDSYRDLSKPMGAQTAERCEDYVDRYMQMKEMGEQPAHYLTHFSSAMIVVGYLVRLRPFNEAFLEVQGGSYDHADRMFSSIRGAWISASKTGRSDVRELIPEFFASPEFLVNHENFDFGLRQDGSDISNVELPPWAKGNARRFIELHAQALESDYVSSKIHLWIDLIFGYLQKSVEHVNVFQALSYEGAINLDTCQNAAERKAAAAAIHSFGQTPHQLFTKPHPSRNSDSAKPWELGVNGKLRVQQVHFLNQSAFVIHDIGQEVKQIHPFEIPTKSLAATSQTILIPPDFNYMLTWGYCDTSLKVCNKTNTAITTLEAMSSSGMVSVACAIDSQRLLVGGTDGLCTLWKLIWENNGSSKKVNVEYYSTLRGHEAPVICLTSSRAFSVAVSGAKDNSIIVWDLNKQCLVHKLSGHVSPITSLSVCDITGDIVACNENSMHLYSINGELLATRNLPSVNDAITSCIFLQTTPYPLFATGNAQGQLCIWMREFDEKEKTQWKINLIRSLDHSFPLDYRPSAGITSLAAFGAGIYTGDAVGRVSYWSLPDSDFHVDGAVVRQCMDCATRFGLVEFRKRCFGCSGIYCTRDSCIMTMTEEGLPGRYCRKCCANLKLALSRKTDV